MFYREADVCILAQRFRWSERDIARMPISTRRRYVDFCLRVAKREHDKVKEARASADAQRPNAR